MGWVKILIFFKVRVSIRTCEPNLGAVRRSCPEISKWSVYSCHPHNRKNTKPQKPKHHSHIGSLNPPGVGWVKLFYFFKVRVSIRTCVQNLGAIRRTVRKKWLSHLKKKLTHPTPGGLSEPMCEWCGDDVCVFVVLCVCGCVGGSCIRFTYLFRDTTSP